jgi:phosphohistidine phosphatase
MRLYVIRHASAEPSSPDGDRGRRLTPGGRAALESAALGLERMGIRFDHLLHSPLVRATETAGLLAGLSETEPAPADALADPPDEALLADIRRLGGRVAVVGHQPWVSELVAWLAFGRPLDGASLVFDTGTVAVLDGAAEPGAMRLLGLFQPGDLSRS